MTESPFDAQLSLLFPIDLPIDQQLDSAERVRVCRAIDQLKTALHQEPPAAIALLEQALIDLGEVAVDPTAIDSTKTALNQAAIEEFDCYFEVVHVKTAVPAACLVKGLLLTYRRFLRLLSQPRRFDPVEIQSQKQGFESYANLLLRVFNVLGEP